MGRGVGHETTSARTVNHTALSLASSFRIASGTSSPSFVDTRSGECGAGPAFDAGVDGSHGLACLPSRFWCAHNKHNAARQQNPAMHAMIIPCQLVGGDAVDDDDESAVGDAHESEEEPGIHFANLSCSPCDACSAVERVLKRSL